MEVVPKPITMRVVTHNAKAYKFYEEQGWKQISTDEAAVLPYHVYRYDIEGDHADVENILIGSTKRRFHKYII